jgi:glycosyltransferase involved in cell wall biosynthesis
MRKILILTNSNPNRIAGIVAKDLLESLRLIKDFEIHLTVNEYDSYKDENITSMYSLFSYFIRRIRNRIEFQANKLKLFRNNKFVSDPVYEFQVYDQSKDYYSVNDILKRTKFKADAIIVLFMERFLTFKNLTELNKVTNAKIYLYPMDMAFFTGGCHYAWSCKGYLKSCGCCPALFSNDPFDQSYLNLGYKKHYIPLNNFKVVPPSEELRDQIIQSSLFKETELSDIFYIPIDEKKYKPINKEIVRNELNLPFDKKIIFFGAYLVTNRRKGFEELVKALKILHLKTSFNKFDKEIHLLIAGYVDDDVLEDISFSYTSLGYLSHQDLPKAFQAADIFASPTLEDSGPMMINQSLMCGTPVVSFEVGVAIDIVVDGVTGYKAEKFNCSQFADGLLALIQLDKECFNQISKNCRKVAVDRFSLQATSSKWQNLILEEIPEN